MIHAMRVGEECVDRDGDHWVMREDGLCCLAPCSHHGQEVIHTCDEHDHMTMAAVERDFGPLREAT